MQRVTVLGIPIDPLTQEEVLQRITGFFRSSGQFHVATPNPEMLVEAQKNAKFQNVLQNTALNLADGAGLVWAAKAPERVTGTDTLQALCASRLGERIFLLGAAEGVAERAAEILRSRYGGLQIAGTFAGSPKPEHEEAILNRINESSPTLLFVAYGAPQQDLWIARNLAKMPTVKVAMGVGGAFDFITGKQKRAPRVMQKIGLEWLWRLIWQPRRIGRIWRAVVIFPLLTMREPHKNEDDVRGADISRNGS